MRKRFAVNKLLVKHHGHMVAIKREFLLHNGNNSRVFQGSVWRASSVKFAVVIDFTPCPLRGAL